MRGRICQGRLLVGRNRRWKGRFELNINTTKNSHLRTLIKLSDTYPPVCAITCTLQEINISHLGKRKIIFKSAFLGDMLVPRRVAPKQKKHHTNYPYIYIHTVLKHVFPYYYTNSYHVFLKWPHIFVLGQIKPHSSQSWNYHSGSWPDIYIYNICTVNKYIYIYICTYVQIYIFIYIYTLPDLENQHGSRTSPFSIGNTSSNAGFAIAMLVFSAYISYSAFPVLCIPQYSTYQNRYGQCFKYV